MDTSGYSTRKVAAPKTPWRAALAAGALLASGAASAHPGLHGGGVLAAFSHPFGGLDHLLAMLAVGAWAACTPRAAPSLPLAFVGAALAGALAGAWGYALPALEPLLALSVVLGGLVLMRRQLPSTVLLAPVAAVLGALHGNAHGLEVSGAQAASALAAFAAGTASLHAAGYAVARLVRARAPRAMRPLGGLLTLAGGVLACA